MRNFIFICALALILVYKPVSAQVTDDAKEKEPQSLNKKSRGEKGNPRAQSNLPRFKNRIPRQLTNVPPAQYPSFGSCRIWYAGRTEDQQPAPVPCSSLAGLPLESGAFILYNGKAYDTEYNWRDDPNNERQKEDGRVVPRQIIEILFAEKRQD